MTTKGIVMYIIASFPAEIMNGQGSLSIIPYKWVLQML